MSWNISKYGSDMEVINLAQCSQNGNENGKIFCYFLWNFYIQNIDFVFVYYLFWNNGLTVLENHFKTNFLGRLSSNFFKNFDFIICTFFIIYPFLHTVVYLSRAFIGWSQRTQISGRLPNNQKNIFLFPSCL